jgi:hypothetical protein
MPTVRRFRFCRLLVAKVNFPNGSGVLRASGEVTDDFVRAV